MDIPDCMLWPVTQNFGYRVVENLSGPRKLVEDRTNRSIEISGDLALAGDGFITKKKASCIFHVDWRWMSNIPKVTCLESWVRKGTADWHINEVGGVCFELRTKWEAEMPQIVESYTFGLGAEYGVKWLVNSTRSLLNRHLFAYRNDLNLWPKGWDFWAHGYEEADRQFYSQHPISTSKSPFQ